MNIVQKASLIAGAMIILIAATGRAAGYTAGESVAARSDAATSAAASTASPPPA
jgi:hypothetical protein